MRLHAIRRECINTIRTCIILSLLSVPCCAEQDINIRESSFLGKLEVISREDVEGPKGPVRIQWDFSREETYTYSLEMNARNQFKTGMFSGERDKSAMQTLVSTGKMQIRSKGDKTADLLIRDLSIEVLISKQDDEEPEKTELGVATPQIIQGLKEDGLLESGDQPAAMLVRTLFALPSRPLEVGESEIIPGAVPFNAMGSALQVKGTISITLARFVEIDGRAHAELNVDFDFSRLEVPEELDAYSDYRVFFKGRSVYYFDLERNLVVSGSTAMLNSMSTRAPMPLEKIDEEEAPDMPGMIDMEMDVDNFTHFSIIK